MLHESAPGIRLDNLLGPTRVAGRAGVTVRNCTADWRLVKPGDAFVAILGDDDDGHDYITRAVSRGAAAVIAEHPVPIFNLPVYVVEDTREAYGELCHALADYPARKIRVIGVVGTQGKSTTAAILDSIFTAAGCDVGVLSSLKMYDGMSRGPGLTGPLSPSVLAARLARMDAAGCAYAIVELSSADLAQRRTSGLELDAVAVTCVEAENLELHQNPLNYRQALRRSLDLLTADGVAVLNTDDQTHCRWLADLNSPSLTYGFEAAAQIGAEIISRNACETVFVLTAGDDSAAIRTTLVGDHHVSNCLAAAAVALSYGLDLQTIARGIESVTRLPARMERIDCGQEYAVFVDAAENATGLRAALRTARQISRGRVICVLGDRTQLAPAAAQIVESVVRKLADLTILTDAAYAGEVGADQIGDDSGVQIASDRGEAIAWALAAADPGDVVVLAGSRGSTDFTFGAAEASDASVLREALYACNTPQLKIAG